MQDFSLDSVRKSLIRQEETIIFAMIERAQFGVNSAIYQPTSKETWDADGSQVDPWLLEKGGSFLCFMLLETEKVHARARRYLSPEETAFFPEQIKMPPVLEPLEYPQVLQGEREININDVVMKVYKEQLVPAICAPGDDQQHGSSALCDIACLQALSRRIHIGKFVAESKYQQMPDKFTELVQARDIAGINELLTNVLVEERVCNRARLKAVSFGQEAFSDAEAGFKVDPNVMYSIYRDMIIPLTKQVQVRYLFERVKTAGGGDYEEITDDEWPANLLAWGGKEEMVAAPPIQGKGLFL